MNYPPGSLECSRLIKLKFLVTCIKVHVYEQCLQSVYLVLAKVLCFKWYVIQQPFEHLWKWQLVTTLSDCCERYSESSRQQQRSDHTASPQTSFGLMSANRYSNSLLLFACFWLNADLQQLGHIYHMSVYKSNFLVKVLGFIAWNTRHSKTIRLVRPLNE